MPAQPLTDEQKADAERLKAIYLRVKKTQNPTLTQATLAELCGWNTQGAVSQYINGKIPLNASAASKFAANLGCSVAEISPSIASEISALSQGMSESTPLPVEFQALLNTISDAARTGSLTPEQAAAFDALIKTTTGSK